MRVTVIVVVSMVAGALLALVGLYVLAVAEATRR